jgi:hypothetical protein
VNLVDTPEMDAFLERLDHTTQAQVLAMTAAWKSTSPGKYEDAWTVIRAVGARDGLTKEIDRVRNKALECAARGTNSVAYTVMDLTRQLRIEAGWAIVGAAVAFALGDRLDAATREVLLGPWNRATEAQGLSDD